MSPTPDFLRHAAEQMADALWRAMQQAVSTTALVASSHQSSIRLLNESARLINAHDLLNMAGLPTDRDTMTRFQKRLKRFRERNFGCCVEIEIEGEHGATYMYHSHLMAHLVHAFAAAINRGENGSTPVA
jgi:hypothetical protein